MVDATSSRKEFIFDRGSHDGSMSLCQAAVGARFERLAGDVQRQVPESFFWDAACVRSRWLVEYESCQKSPTRSDPH